MQVARCNSTECVSFRYFQTHILLAVLGLLYRSGTVPQATQTRTEEGSPVIELALSPIQHFLSVFLDNFLSRTP